MFSSGSVSYSAEYSTDQVQLHLWTLSNTLLYKWFVEINGTQGMRCHSCEQGRQNVALRMYYLYHGGDLVKHRAAERLQNRHGVVWGSQTWSDSLTNCIVWSNGVQWENFLASVLSNLLIWHWTREKKTSYDLNTQGSHLTSLSSYKSWEWKACHI